MTKFIVSYRRTDTPIAAGWIAESLQRHFGTANVFMDIDHIPIGRDYREHIRQILNTTDILIAVVGPKWMEADSSGKYRINDDRDWVRLEIATALARKEVTVIPLLIDGTVMPSPDQFPADVREFAFRNAAYINTREFKTYMERLISSLERLIGEQKLNPESPPEFKPPGSKSRAKSVAVSIGVAVTIAGFFSFVPQVSSIAKRAFCPIVNCVVPSEPATSENKKTVTDRMPQSGPKTADTDANKMNMAVAPPQAVPSLSAQTQKLTSGSKVSAEKGVWSLFDPISPNDASRSGKSTFEAEARNGPANLFDPDPWNDPPKKGTPVRSCANFWMKEPNGWVPIYGKLHNGVNASLIIFRNAPVTGLYFGITSYSSDPKPAQFQRPEQMSKEVIQWDLKRWPDGTQFKCEGQYSFGYRVNMRISVSPGDKEIFYYTEEDASWTMNSVKVE